LNMPFAIEKRISFSTLSSKMSRRFVWQKAMRIKQGLPTYNAPIYLRTECSERKKRRGPNKSARSNLVHNLRYKFYPHRHLRRRQVLIFLMREYIDAPKFCAHCLLIK
jgi:hypothetical protein